MILLRAASTKFFFFFPLAFDEGSSGARVGSGKEVLTQPTKALLAGCWPARVRNGDGAVFGGKGQASSTSLTLSSLHLKASIFAGIADHMTAGIGNLDSS